MLANVLLITKKYNERFKDGVTLKDQDLMRSQLVSYLQVIQKPGIIYIDIDSDIKDSYYYGQIYRYGPLYWMIWYDKSINDDTVPRSIFDYDLLKSSVITQDGVTGILYQGKFYKPNNFSAVRVMDKKVINIKDQVIEDLKLSQK